MRIVLTTPYDLAVPGGVNRHVFDLLDALTARGHTVRLLGPASAPLRTDDRVRSFGRIWTGGFNGAVTRITLDWRIGGAVGGFMRAFRPDVVHLQEPFVPLLNAFVLWHAGGARRIGTFHTYSETSRGYLWSWPWCHWINRRLDVRVAITEAARGFAAQFHPAKYELVPHGIRLPPANEMRPLRPPGEPVRLLFVGRADEPRKGFAVLREAFRQLTCEHPGCYALTVVGPNEALATDRSITWRGKLTEPELRAAYAGADIVVVPSLGGESFGLVALEALAHGVPVVASRIHGYAEWLDGTGTGELVPPGEAAALAAAIRRLAGDAAVHARCAQRAREVAASYDWERRVGRLIRLYEGAPVSNDEG